MAMATRKRSATKAAAPRKRAAARADVDRYADLPQGADCGRPIIADGLCRQRILHPEEFECGRCTGKALPDRVVPPSQTAARGEWIDYAVATGMDRDAAGNLARDELVDLVGSRLAPSVFEGTEPVEPETPTTAGTVVAASADAATTTTTEEGAS